MPGTIDAHTGRQHRAFARGNLHVTVGNGTGGEVEDDRISPGPRCGEGDRVGAEQGFLRTMRHHAGHAVDHAQRHQPFTGKRLDVRPKRSEVVRIANRQHRNAGAFGFFYQQRSGSRQGWLGKTATGIYSNKCRADILDLGLGLAIHPTAGQRRHVAGNPKNPVAVGAITLGAGAVIGQHRSDLRRGAVALEHLAQQLDQISEGNNGGIAGCRHMQLRCTYWIWRCLGDVLS